MKWNTTPSPHFVFSTPDANIDMDTPPQVGEYVTLTVRNIECKAQIVSIISENRFEGEVTEVSQDDKPVIEAEGISKGHCVYFDLEHITFLYRQL